MAGGGSPALANILMLYLSLLGLGALGGYAGFYYSFSGKCSVLLQEAQARHDTSRQAFQDKYEAAIEGQRQCLVGSNVKDQYHQLQEKLASQTTLADRHQALLDKQETMLGRLSTLQQLSQDNGNTMYELRVQLNQARMELTTTKQTLDVVIGERDAFTADVRSQLEEKDIRLEQRENEVQLLQHHAREVERVMPVLKEELNFIKDYFRQRSYALCKMVHGPGPFKVEFTLLFPRNMGTEGPSTFSIELAQLSDMPHTISTFLELVDLQLFDGTAFVSSSAQMIEGGSPNHADVSRSVKIYETYFKYGYNRTPLGFNEYSTKHPHIPWTIGFLGSPHAGPILAINMADNSKSRGPTSDGHGGEPCFGTIISGFDTLKRIQSAPKSADGNRLAKNVEILSVRLINDSP